MTSREQSNEALRVVLNDPKADGYAQSYADAMPIALREAASYGCTEAEAEHTQLLYVLNNLRAVTPALKAAKKTLHDRVKTLQKEIDDARRNRR